MWGVDPRKLCDQHLLGEHREMHQEVGTLENHPHGEKIVKGHARKKQVDTSLIQQRHDELVEEMEQRSFSHSSPMSYSDSLGTGEIDVERNREELADRCEDCREKIRS